MEFRRSSSIPGVVLCAQPTHADVRGFFKEVVRLEELQRLTGTSFAHGQWNHAFSKRFVLRGIHVASYAKVLYVSTGEVRAYFVDGRPQSPTCGALHAEFLGHDTSLAVYLPAGIGNAYVTMTENVHYLYLVEQEYDPTHERTIRWDDPALNIAWPRQKLVISERDRNGLSFVDYLQEAPAFLATTHSTSG